MLPSDNYYMIGVMIYGAAYMLGVAVTGAIMGVPAATFFALLALAVCYLQLMAALANLSQFVQNLCFWLALPSATIAGVVLAYHIIIR
jgi:hypothetical protein